MDLSFYDGMTGQGRRTARSWQKVANRCSGTARRRASQLRLRAVDIAMDPFGCRSLSLRGIKILGFVVANPRFPLEAILFDGLQQRYSQRLRHTRIRSRANSSFGTLLCCQPDNQVPGIGKFASFVTNWGGRIFSGRCSHQYAK